MSGEKLGPSPGCRVAENIKNLGLYGIPLGVLFRGVELTEEASTGLERMNEALREEGVVLLITHHNRLDALWIAAAVLGELEVSEVVAPEAGYLREIKLFKRILCQVNRGVGSEFRCPRVAREKERRIGVLVGEEERLNREYMMDALGVLGKPGGMVFVAGCGQRTETNEKLDPGVVGLLVRSGVSVFVVAARFEPGWDSGEQGGEVQGWGGIWRRLMGGLLRVRVDVSSNPVKRGDFVSGQEGREEFERAILNEMNRLDGRGCERVE